MFFVSQQAFKQALQHAQTIEAHGKAFEKMARSLEGQLLTRAQVEAMECAGQQIQQQGQIMMDLVEQALQEDELYLLEKYAIIHQQHRLAVLLYLTVIEVILQATKTALLCHYSASSRQ